jgi:hypothetical protein
MGDRQLYLGGRGARSRIDLRMDGVQMSADWAVEPDGTARRAYNDRTDEIRAWAEEYANIGDTLGDIDAIKLMIMEMYKVLVPYDRRAEIAAEQRSRCDAARTDRRSSDEAGA